MSGVLRAGMGWDWISYALAWHEWQESWLLVLGRSSPDSAGAPLPQGRSRVLTGEPTLHTRTACMVAEALTAAKFSISPAEGRGRGLWMLECQGAAVAAP